MKKNNWIKGAVLLGFSFFIAVFFVKPIGVSTQFSVLSGIVHSSIDKNVISQDSSRKNGYISTNAYYDNSEGKLAKEIKNPINYDFVFVLAIPLGGALGYTVLKKKKEASDENEIIDNTCLLKNNNNFLSTYLSSFIGGFILLYGARMADGCTSGHMMSGMMQSSVSGYFFAVSVFATAIPTAIIIKKLKNKR